MSDIFLSYAREDIAVAQLLATALEACGWSVFWDRRIPAGRRFADVIADELDAAKCVIVLWSSAATASDWVLDEAEEARQRNVLAPALIEPIQPPMGFRRIHAADLIGWQGEPAHTGYRRLLEDVAQYVAPALAAAPETPPGPHQSSVATETAPAAASETGSNSYPSSAPGATVADHQRGRGRVSVRKWAGALAAVIVLAVLSNWLINSIRRFDTQQRAEQDPAAGAGAPGAAAEPAAGQNSGVPKIPSDRSASRESKPPPAAPATSPAPVGSERNPPKTLEDAALALLPDPALRRQRDAPWRRAASADLLIQMDQIEESIVAAFSALDRTPPADRYERHSQHSAELRGVLEPPSTPMDEAALVGNWLCRTTSVGNHGVLTYTYFECTIRKTAPCLQLRKTGGSSRFEGCLYRLDDRTYVHVGTPKGIDSPTAEGRLGGFLTQMRPGRLRLLEATGPSTFGVLDFKRR